MVRPAVFKVNTETAADNFFQVSSEEDHTAAAQEQFDTIVDLLKQHEINIWVINDSSTPKKPDAVFPNNWFACNNNKLTLFPMYAANRRTERREEIISLVKESTGIDEVIDLTIYEKENKFLEGTGSMCFDHPDRIIYACRSERTDESLLKKYAEDNKYRFMIFDAVDLYRKPVYHTNVMMCIGTSLVVVCADSIKTNRNGIMESLSQNRELLMITKEQMHAFAGNMLEVKNKSGEKYFLMSRTARNSLTELQFNTISKHATPLILDADIIEMNGGSVRCMMAEINLTGLRPVRLISDRGRF